MPHAATRVAARRSPISARRGQPRRAARTCARTAAHVRAQGPNLPARCLQPTTAASRSSMGCPKPVADRPADYGPAQHAHVSRGAGNELDDFRSGRHPTASSCSTLHPLPAQTHPHPGQSQRGALLGVKGSRVRIPPSRQFFDACTLKWNENGAPRSHLAPAGTAYPLTSQATTAARRNTAATSTPWRRVVSGVNFYLEGWIVTVQAQGSFVRTERVAVPATAHPRLARRAWPPAGVALGNPRSSLTSWSSQP